MNRKTYQARAINRTAVTVDVDDLIREMDRKHRRLASAPITAESARSVLEDWHADKSLTRWAVTKLMPSSEHTHWTEGQMRVWLEGWCRKVGVR